MSYYEIPDESLCAATEPDDGHYPLTDAQIGSHGPSDGLRDGSQ